MTPGVSADGQAEAAWPSHSRSAYLASTSLRQEVWAGPGMPTSGEAPAPLIISGPRAGMKTFPEMTTTVTGLDRLTGITG